MKFLNLNKNTRIPILGFGTWQLSGNICQKSVEKALEVGYRHIDTADDYGNHHEVGEAIKASGLKRENLFLTTKIWWTDLKRESVLSCGKTFLKELQTQYIDLLLIHWPNHKIPISETLGAMNDLMEKGIVKEVGVSNFTINHLKEVKETGYRICNDQIEFHPSLNQRELVDFCKQNKIIVTAYSPNAQGQDLKISEIQILARKYGKTESQIILKWIVSKEIVTIPRSDNNKHIEENFQIWDWELEDEDKKKMDNLNSDNRLTNPDFAEFSY
jgi:2,5-diketo-D-gluconate reductase B